MAILRKLLDYKLACLGLSLILLLGLTALFAPIIAPHDPLAVDLMQKLQPPSSRFLLGTDHLGRCILSRLIYGSRVSLSISLVVVLFTTAVSLVVGLTAGYVGGRVDSWLMRLCDVFLAFPALILSLAIVGILGAGLGNLIFALTATHWAGYARIVRSRVLSVKESDFIQAAIVSGTSKPSIMLRHILPYTIAELAILASLDVSHMILHIAGLSFLGLGIQPPTPEWGAMINDGREYFRRMPELMLYPGLMIFLTTLAFNLVGDVLRDVLDPRMEQQRQAELLGTKLQNG
ncbi:nickel ABC transporter permease subunit NikC [Rivularia sp. UHCC 0363]|uniref:nickel ABC transporter permease subunit NikC n=1 Tax=Rivularia sp. UHCC 0363 TaxID=3110244 RepID=UPI002B214C89|nr:nickel ABC transporter permease subunit NikC [Rivularia sp. UHCC 0363]MEA5598825.1 nickel ABC transporter permease subunit NikC [Rivularia sp. UHCC 0363]